jgi:hypothetical protein
MVPPYARPAERFRGENYDWTCADYTLDSGDAIGTFSARTLRQEPAAGGPTRLCRKKARDFHRGIHVRQDLLWDQTKEYRLCFVRNTTGISTLSACRVLKSWILFPERRFSICGELGGACGICTYRALRFQLRRRLQRPRLSFLWPDRRCRRPLPLSRPRSVCPDASARRSDYDGDAAWFVLTQLDLPQRAESS